MKMQLLVSNAVFIMSLVKRVFFFFKSKSSKSVFPSVTFIGVALFTFNQGTTEKFYKITSANTLALICDATVVFKNDSRYTLSEPHFSICLQRLGVTVYFLFCWFACDVFFFITV